MRAFFIHFVVLTLAFAASASASGQTTMTLQDCMKYAISNSTKLRIQQAEAGDARIDRRDAALALFTPSINAQTYAYYNFGRSIDPKTNTYFKTTSFHNNYGVSAGYDLFDGFQAVNNYRISKTGMQIAESQQKQVEADICLAVMEAYYNVVYYKRLADVYDELVSVSEQNLSKAKKQEEIGQKSHADVIQMEADLANAKYDYINTINMYKSQLMTLSDLMFWPLDQELVIITDLPDQMVQENEIVETGFAVDHNPQVQIANMKQLNAQRLLNTAKWQVLPSVGVYAGWSTSYYTYQGSTTSPFIDQFKNNSGAYVQFSLSIPIWDRLNTYSRISKRRNAYKRATAELDQKRREVESEIRRAMMDRDGSSQAYDMARLKSEVQAEAYNLNLKKLEQGLISPLEFNLSNNNYLKAQADEMSCLFKYLIKEAVVKYYNGVEYIDQ